MNKSDHIKAHKQLHHQLDVLVANFIQCTKKLPSNTTLGDFMAWSYLQTVNPTEHGDAEGEPK